ncbi:MAG: AI-2E family transporter [Oscillospiraceae bacterium]|jgi:predicted PurR-regulated permease PerM|nr:AI-2E family transporter [Bacillota bacterium]
MLPKKPKTRYTQAMGLIAFAVGLYALINHLSVIGSVFHFLTNLLEPLIVGAILAFFLNVPMRGLEKLFFRLQTRRRWKVRERANEVVSLILTYVGGFLLIFLVMYIVIPQLVETIPGIVSSAESAWPKLMAFLQSHNINTQQLEQLFSNFDLGPLLTKVWENYAQIIQTSLTAVSTVTSVLTVAITGFVISIYILSNKKKLLSQVRRLLYAYVGRKYADKVSEVASLTNQTFSSFISGQCVEAVILGVMFFLVMSILRLPYSLVISVFIAFMALIPYVGAFLGCVVGMLLIVIVSPMQALVFLITFLVLQQLEGQLIYPKVVGSSVGLPAIWILVSVFVGGKLFGIVGMLFFIPLTSVVYSLLRLNVNHRLEKRGISITTDGVQDSPSQEDPA